MMEVKKQLAIDLQKCSECVTNILKFVDLEVQKQVLAPLQDGKGCQSISDPHLGQFINNCGERTQCLEGHCTIFISDLIYCLGE